jgi:hypothetical protein
LWLIFASNHSLSRPQVFLSCGLWPMACGLVSRQFAAKKVFALGFSDHQITRDHGDHRIPIACGLLPFAKSEIRGEKVFALGF